MAGEPILIVEDNEKSRKLVRDILQVKGYRTLETETAEEGIRLAQESRPAQAYFSWTSSTRGSVASRS